MKHWDRRRASRSEKCDTRDDNEPKEDEQPPPLSNRPHIPKRDKTTGDLPPSGNSDSPTGAGNDRQVKSNDSRR